MCVWALAPPSKELPDPAASTRPAVTRRLMLQGGATPRPWQSRPLAPLTTRLLLFNLVCPVVAAENKAQAFIMRSCLCFFQAALLFKDTLASHTNFKNTKTSFPAAHPLAEVVSRSSLTKCQTHVAAISFLMSHEVAAGRRRKGEGGTEVRGRKRTEQERVRRV